MITFFFMSLILRVFLFWKFLFLFWLLLLLTVIAFLNNVLTFNFNKTININTIAFILNNSIAIIVILSFSSNITANNSSFNKIMIFFLSLSFPIL